MSDFKNSLYLENKELFDASAEIGRFTGLLLRQFNRRKLNLFDLLPHQRISLFFFARAVKTYSAAALLCREGYGQDVSTLLRSLLENLISLKYILVDKACADEKAARFVEYKWAILKRCFSQDADRARGGDSAEPEKTMLAGRLKEFKQKYKVSSDKALLTWSGKTIRDMAGRVDKNLLGEYDSTFRLCSRFSHPSIIGDKEYLAYENNRLRFSALPGATGVVHVLKRVIRYQLDFFAIFAGLFDLCPDKELKHLQARIEAVLNMDKYRMAFSPAQPISDLDKVPHNQIILEFDGVPQ